VFTNSYVTWSGSHIGLSKNIKKYFLLISVKLHNYDLVFMGNIGFKFQPDQTHGLAA